MKITFSVLGRLLGAALVVAFNPSVTHAGFVGPTMITINGGFTDWTNNVYSITNTTPLQYKAASDLDAFWMAMSTANGTSPASSANRIQNVYYRLDVGKDPSGGGGQAYWIQMNLGVAPPGFADHILQVFANASGTPAVSLTLFQFITNSSTPYPAVAVFTVKTAQVVAKVSNDSTISGAVVDANATVAFAANGSGYSIEMKLPIGWFTNATYGGTIKDDGTGPAFVETAVFSATGSKGAVGTPQDKIVDASGNEYYAQQSTATGAATFTANNATGYAFSVGAAAATLTPVVSASDSITLTVNQNNGGTIVTDTTYTGAHNVTISGFTAAPNGSYGSLNGTTLTGSSVTISVTFASGVATIPLVLDNAATQNIQFSISDLTVPEANVLALTPTAGAATKLAFTTSPVTTTAGVASSTITVQRQDQFGNPNTADASRTVTLSSSSTGTKTFAPTSLTISSGSSSANFTYTDTQAGTPTNTAASTSPSTITSATQQETVTKATPGFSGLTASSSTNYGTTSITLSGKLSAAGPVYPAIGETITVTINGNAQTTTVNDSTGDFSISYNPSTIPYSASAYTITCSYAGDANLNSASDTSTTLTVNKATPTVTVTVGSYTYTGSAQGPNSVTTASSGAVTWSYVGVSGTSYGPSATRPTGAGSYTATATVAADANYNSASSSATAFTIAKATLTVTPNAVSTTYNGTTLNNSTYSDNTANYSITGFQNSENVSSAGVTLSGSMAFNSSTSTTVKDAGTYTQAAGTLALAANNYSMSFANPTPNNYVITPKALTVTGATVTSKVYDGNTTATITGAALLTAESAGTSTTSDGKPYTGDTVTLGDDTSGTFADQYVGAGKSVTTAMTISGAQANNYTLTQPTLTGDITANPPVANPLTYYRAKNTSIKISITNLIALHTSQLQGDSLGLVAVAGGLLTNNTVIATTTNGSSVYIANPYHGSAYIVLTPTNNLNETFPYVVNDTSYPALTATNLITITVTNAVGQLTGNIYQSGDGGVTTTWAGIPGSSYVVQRSTDLSSWTDLWTTNAPAAGVFSFTDPSPPNPAYYRVRQN